MNTDNFIIESEDLELAQSICNLISNADIRDRAVANALAAEVAGKYFDKEQYNIDTKSGLHNIGTVLQDIDISDIYINDAYIDVRVLFNEEEAAVPVLHFEHGLLPAAYMFIKVAADLSGAYVLGFKSPDNIDKTQTIDGYYKVREDSFESFYDVEPLLSSYITENVNIEDSDIYAYLDGALHDKINFYSQLLKSREARLKLAKAEKAKNVFQYISVKAEGPHSNQETQDDLPELVLAEDSTFNLDTQGVSDSESDPIDNIDDISLDISDLSDVPIDNETLNIEEQNKPESVLDEEDSDVISNLTLDDLEIELPEDTMLENGNGIPNSNELQQADEKNSNTDNKYSTVITPELNENELLEQLQQEIPKDNKTELNNNSDEQIEKLFNNNDDMEETSPGIKVYPQKRSAKKSVIAPLIILTSLILIAALGYTGYTKFLSAPPSDDKLDTPLPESSVNDQKNNIKAAKAEDAMPIETVETTQLKDEETEVSSTSIPMIEQNLDASILVSNLKVNWEVPSGYVSNSSAQRYLVKLGKIIQLNLKTELLLLSKPPITNKIAVEIQYNNNSKKFEAIGVTISSGEKSVDDLILQTVNKALAMSLNMNTDSFAKLQGNPILVIHF